MFLESAQPYPRIVARAGIAHNIIRCYIIRSYKLSNYKKQESSMFVGREKELATLEVLYASGKFEMPVIYGRRRVAKRVLLANSSRANALSIFKPDAQMPRQISICFRLLFPKE